MNSMGQSAPVELGHREPLVERDRRRAKECVGRQVGEAALNRTLPVTGPVADNLAGMAMTLIARLAAGLLIMPKRRESIAPGP